MKIHSICIKNFGPFSDLEEVRLGSLATIIGKNDTGKSYILRAIQIYFGKKIKLEERDVHDGADQDDKVVIEIAFSSLPEEIELEEGVGTSLNSEMLTDPQGYLRIRKNYHQTSLQKPNILLIANDFDEDDFACLTDLTEPQLNLRCTEKDIDILRSGRGITNKGKREELRNKAREGGITVSKREISIKTNKRTWKCISSLLPEYKFFAVDTKLGVGETTFQSQFRPIVKKAAESSNVVAVKDEFTQKIQNGLQGEVDKIFKKFKQHTDDFEALSAKPNFSWDKAVTFEIFGMDQHGVEKSLDQRGSGMKRLLMVAYFQYLAERTYEMDENFVFTLEEPENCLHPGLQRELVSSFRQLVEKGNQVILTSHSPVFAGESPIEDLILLTRNEGVATAIQYPALDLPVIAMELGIEPADQIIGYSACVFVEGIDDIRFWKSIASKLKDANRINANFDDK